MYDEEETGCFDPNSMATTGIELVEENGLISQETSPPFTPVLDYLHHQMDPSMELHNIQNPNFSMYNTTPDNVNVDVEMGNFSHYINNNDPDTPITSTSNLLTLLHLPRCSFSSSSTLLPPTPLGFLNGIQDNPSGSGSNNISYDPTTTMPFDPLFHLNLPPQPSPLLRDLMFQTLPMGYRGENGDVMNMGLNSLFGRLDEGGEGGDIINGVNGIYLEGDTHHHHMNSNGIFEFSANGIGNACLAEDKEGKCPKNFVTERQRRQNFNDKYNHLRRLVPNPTKPDRASIVKDAIDYIQELKRTVGELRLLVEKKRISKERSKRHKTEEKTSIPTTPSPDGTIIVDKDKDNAVQCVTNGSGQVKPDPDEGFNSNQLRSSWLLRKWKDSEVDVRIVDDDVTIKLVQRKKINCLMAVSRTLDELQLDLRHVAGGHVGDYYSYLFNTKICEGSSVYASAIANKLIEVVERQYAVAAATSITF